VNVGSSSEGACVGMSVGMHVGVGSLYYNIGSDSKDLVKRMILDVRKIIRIMILVKMIRTIFFQMINYLNSQMQMKMNGLITCKKMLALAKHWMMHWT